MSTRIKKLLVLGSGASSAVPSLRCLARKDPCGICRESQKNPFSKNHRRNTSILLQVQTSSVSSNILVDCGKTFRAGALQFFPEHGVSSVDSLLLTHFHADAMLGMDDIREYSTRNSLPTFCDAPTKTHLERVFPYLFHQSKTRWVGSCDVHVVEPKKRFEIEGLPVWPIALDHGDCDSLGFLFPHPEGGLIAYFSDVGNVTPEEISWVESLGDIRLLFLDCISQSSRHNPCHLTLERSLHVAEQLKATKTFLVGMNHTMDYDTINKELVQRGKDVCCSYDGMVLEFHDK